MGKVIDQPGSCPWVNDGFADRRLMAMRSSVYPAEERRCEQRLRVTRVDSLLRRGRGEFVTPASRTAVDHHRRVLQVAQHDLSRRASSTACRRANSGCGRACAARSLINGRRRGANVRHRRTRRLAFLQRFPALATASHDRYLRRLRVVVPGLPQPAAHSVRAGRPRPTARARRSAR